ncbi:MAG: oligopeptide ABC transporter substrate-binding protein, partial [Lactobacillus helsingborgensis]|nr:oligopeptide ABC transporter substrate-binding protein [Lactobacillus helsingborgensis]
MKKRSKFASAGILCLAALTLAACAKNANNSDDTKTVKKFTVETPIKNVKNGGTVKVAVVADTPFSGIFSQELSSEDVDSMVAAP